MALLELPIDDVLPAYTFQIDLEENLYLFTFRFNLRMNRWVMDIADEDEVVIIQGIKLLINQNLLRHYVMDNLPPGIFLLVDESGNDAQPDRFNFGNDVKLLYQESTT